jgi:hypothetical protein
VNNSTPWKLIRLQYIQMDTNCRVYTNRNNNRRPSQARHFCKICLEYAWTGILWRKNTSCSSPYKHERTDTADVPSTRKRELTMPELYGLKRAHSPHWYSLLLEGQASKPTAYQETRTSDGIHNWEEKGWLKTKRYKTKRYKTKRYKT